MKTEDIEAEKKEILRHVEEYEAAENRKDIEGILELLTEDCVVVLRSAKYEGIASTREWLEGIPDFISSKHVPLRVEVSSSGDMAWLLGHEIFRREKDEGIVETRGNYLITLRKVDGKWKAVAICVT
jgi:ketosteroid isomerase-like protein